MPEPDLSYYKVALPFARSVPTQDSEDLLHTIIANLADAARNGKPKPDNPSWMYRIASFAKAQYWRTYYKLNNGLDCGSCSKAQRKQCRKDWLYGECPKAVKIERLSKPITDSEGNLTELGNLIVDPDSLDPDVWERESLWQIGYKPRLVDIANKLKAGTPLTKTDSQYLWRYRQQAQKRLEGM